MRSGNRRSAMRVRDGRVQKKNNWTPDRSDYHVRRQDEIQLDRRAPGPEFKHVMTIAQLRAFVELLPDWDEVAVGLDAIVLDEGQDCMGWYGRGVVAVCAWEQELWWDECDRDFEADHRIVDPKLQVYIVVKSAGSVVKSFQSPCLVTPAGGAQTTQGSFILKKHVKVSKKGTFSYAGPATLQETYRKVAINVTIAGRFKHGKAKGTVTFDAATAACEKTTFSAKYYGLHPQG
jgi:hypothetical protein